MEVLEHAFVLHHDALLGYCYQTLRSRVDSEDAVQETWIRARRGLRTFQSRGTLRSWLFRIASRVCIDFIRRRPRLQVTSQIEELALEESDPAKSATQEETVREAFFTMLRYLPPRLRAVLILPNILGWKAAEVADLLGTSVVSVNSALQRARAAVGGCASESLPREISIEEDCLLSTYTDAFLRNDVPTLVAQLRNEALHRTINGRLDLPNPISRRAL